MPSVQITTNPVTVSNVVTLDEKISNWQHRHSSFGFDSAEFDIFGTQQQIEDKFYNYLGRRITRYSPDGHFVIWDGQIVEMILQQPGLQRRLSLRDMYNRVSVRYVPIDTTANPPTESAETSTAVANNTTSQAIYGIKETVFRPPQNRLTATDAAQMRDTIKGFYYLPLPSDSSRFGGGRDTPSLHVICEGYYHTLGWRVYNQTANSSTQNANLAINDILGVGQFIASKNLSTNTTAVQKYFNRDNTAKSLIDWIVSLGDSGFNRWLAYVYEDRKLVYEAAPNLVSTVKYYRRMADHRQEIREKGGMDVPYWAVRAGHWMWTTDTDMFRLPTYYPRDNPQISFIESVTWDEEKDSLTTEGAKSDKMQIMIARAAAQGDAIL